MCSHLAFYNNFRASERKRELIKLIISVGLSVALCLIIFCSAFSIAISKLGVSELSEALDQLNFTSTLHRIEINQSLSTKHYETAESVTNTADELTRWLNIMSTNLVELEHQLHQVVPKVPRM